MTPHTSRPEKSNTLDVVVPAGPEGAGVARHQLSRFERGLTREVMDNLRLMVSELVTNSIRHAGLADGTSIGVKVQLRTGRIRVEVVDPGPGFEPVSVMPSMYQTGGWGLYLVDQLADRWGVIKGEATKVWFELDERPRERRMASTASRG
jgi:anti-sigma regulatory factor (Ser/Thr protein kinase)